MKKITYSFIALAFFAVISLSSCKTKTTQVPAVDSTVVEEAPSMVDTSAADTAMVR
jgi:hypothetical protein